MTETSLYQALKTYTDSDVYPFHMPGHKRNLELLAGMLAGTPYGIDITEIESFDNLHHAEGILEEAQERAARLYGARESFFLINGSTCGILASIFAVTTQGGKLLMARNCHKAAYHAAELRALRLRYLYPEWRDYAFPVPDGGMGLSFGENISGGGTGRRPGTFGPVLNGPIDPEDVEKALREDPGLQAVFLTSPTYDGVVSDIGRIAEIAHRYGKPLVVDEAHGAHFGFHPYFPDSSVHQGADLVIHSLHKTLPSLTQTALLHVGTQSGTSEVHGCHAVLTEETVHAGKRSGKMEAHGCHAEVTEEIMAARIRKYLGIFETSSPSYVLMAGIDQCVELLRTRGPELFETYAQRLSGLRRELSGLRHVHLFSRSESEGVQIDPSKLILSLDGVSGRELSGILRNRYHLEMEMEAPDYVIALTSLADTQEGFDRLLQACRELDEEADKRKMAGELSRHQQKAAANRAEAQISRRRAGEAIEAAGAAKDADITGDMERMELQQSRVRDIISAAVERESESVLLEHCSGRISAEYIYLYPPGIPLVVPGEELTVELVEKLLQYRAQDLKLEGMQDYSGKYLNVCIVSNQKG